MAVIDQANDQYTVTQNAINSALNQADTTNTNIANVNNTASTAPSYTDLASQTSFLNNLQNQLQALNTQATGPLQTSATTAQQALDAYNALLKANGISTTQPNPAHVLSPNLPDFLDALKSYDTQMNDYLTKAKAIVAGNESAQKDADAINDACKNCVTPTLATLTDLKNQVNTQLAAQYAAVEALKASTTRANLDSEKAKGEAAAAQLATLIPKYEAAYKAYMDCVTKYNAALDTAHSNGDHLNPFPSKLPTDVAPFQTAVTDATKAMNQNNDALSHNYTVGQAVPPINNAWQSAENAYNDYKTAVDAQNTAQENLAAIVAQFPMASSTVGEPTATNDLEAWQQNYTSAVQALQTAIANTDTAGTAYQTALDTYNALTSNPLYPAGCNPTTITNNPTNPGTDYLNALQSPTNLDDLTTGTGAIPQAMATYLAQQPLADAYNQANASAAAYQAVLERIYNDVQNAKNAGAAYDSWYQSVMGPNGSGPQLQNGINPGDTSAVFQAFSQTNAYLTALQTSLTDLQDVVSSGLLDSTYNQFMTDAGNYNTVATPAGQTAIDTTNATTFHTQYHNLVTTVTGTSANGFQNLIDVLSPNLDSANNLLFSQTFTATNDEEMQSQYQAYFDSQGWGSVLVGQSWLDGPGQYDINWGFSNPQEILTIQKPNVTPLTPPSFTTDFTGPDTEDLVPNQPCQPLTPDFLEGTTATVPTGTPCTSATPTFTPLPDAPTFTGVTVNPVYPPVAPSPAIDIVKSSGAITGPGTGNATTPETAVNVPSGTSTQINYRITNLGQEPLTNITVTDQTTQGTVSVQNITYQDSSQNPLTIGTDGYLHTADGSIFNLPAGDYITATGTLPPLPPGELHANTATVNGTGTDTGQTVTDQDPWHGKTPASPAIDIVKSSGAITGPGLGNNAGIDDNLGDGDANTPDTAVTVPSGTSTQINYRITNLGQEPLTNITVSDQTTQGTVSVQNITYQDSSQNPLTIGTDGYLHTADGSIFNLPAGDYITATGTLPPLPPGELHANTATVTGTGTLTGQTVTDQDPWHGKTPASPAIDIVKSSGAITGPGTGNANTPDTAVNVPSGTSTQINYRITNLGQEPLTNIIVSDQTTQGTVSVQNITYQDSSQNPLTIGTDGYLHTADGSIFNLPAGDYITATGTLPPLPPGELHANTATVTGTGTLTGQTVTDQDPWHGKTPASPAIDIVKSSGAITGPGTGNANTPDTAISVPNGASTPLYYRITNNGTEPLTNLVVTDTTTAGSVTVTDINYSDSAGHLLTVGADGYLHSLDGTLLVLAPGDYITATGTLPPLPPGELHANTATVTGTGTDTGHTVSDSDKWHGITQTPCLIGKCCCCQKVCPCGLIGYDICEVNCDCVHVPQNPCGCCCDCAHDQVFLQPNSQFCIRFEAVVDTKKNNGRTHICAYVDGQKIEPCLRTKTPTKQAHCKRMSFTYQFTTGDQPECLTFRNCGCSMIKVCCTTIVIKKM